MEITLKTTNIFTKNMEAYTSGYRFIINEGSSRSSKTYSILQLLIYLAITNSKTTISIVRKSMPSLRISVYKDWYEIMTDLGLYTKMNHNKTENTYKFPNGSEFQFFGIDDEQKVRGSKRNICYINEATELTSLEFNQLSIRTDKCLFVDYNPSDTESYLYELVKDKRSAYIHSTYLDNIYLQKELKEEIENYINTDYNFYQIFALGLRPTTNSKIYSHFKKYTKLPEGNFQICWGVDWGWTDPCVLVKCCMQGNKVYVKEYIYKNHITIAEFSVMINEIVDRNSVYVDTSMPSLIEELKRKGVQAKKSNKLIKEGIDYIRSKEIYIHEDSTNIWDEYKHYIYKVIKDKIIEIPVDIKNHAMDAMRYAIFSNKKSSINLGLIKFY